MLNLFVKRVISMDCLEVVRKNKQKIEDYIKKFAEIKGLKIIDIFVYKSRAAGICRPNSDIDIYLQLDPKHAQLIEEQGDVWGDHKGLSLGEEMRKYGLTLVDMVQWNGMLYPIELDVRAGIEPYPPVNQKKYKKLIEKGVPYALKLSDI